MTKITNNIKSTLYIGGTKLAPGVETAVENWDHVKKTGAVPKWIETKVISVGGETKSKSSKSNKSDDAPTKAELIEQIESLGGTANKRDTVAKLTEQLDDLTAPDPNGSEEE